MRVPDLFLWIFTLSVQLPLYADIRSDSWAFEKCRLNIKRIKGISSSQRFVFLNGVPVTSIIYEELGKKLNRELQATVDLVDLPGTGLSRNSSYSWSATERCIHSYLKDQKKDFILLVHDIAGPIVLPTLADKSLKLKGAIILNTILSPTNFRPLFPLNLLRTPFLGALVSPLIPFFYFEKEMRSKGIERNEDIESSQIRNIYDEFSRSFGKLRLHRVMRGFELNELREKRIRAGLSTSLPKLTIWGMRDPSLGGQFQYVSQIKNNKVLRLAKAKHFLMLDYVDEIAIAIKAFSIRI